MEILKLILSNPIVVAVGYIMSFIAACIAVYQTVGKSNAHKLIINLNNKIDNLNIENNELNVKIDNLNIENNELNVKTDNFNNNTVSQGEKSQYFQDNQGPVKIDMRG